MPRKRLRAPHRRMAAVGLARPGQPRPTWDTKLAPRAKWDAGQGVLFDGADEPFAVAVVHFIDQDRLADACGPSPSSAAGLGFGGADDRQVVGIVADLVGHSVIPGLILPERSSQPRASAQSVQIQVPVPSTTTGAK